MFGYAATAVTPEPTRSACAVALLLSASPGCGPFKECVDEYCVRGGDQAAADQFGRMLRDDPTIDKDAKTRCDYWLGVSLRLKSEVTLMPYIDQVREKACAQDTAQREGERKKAAADEAATLVGMKELEGGACTAEHQQALEGMRDAVAKGMQLKIWSEGRNETFRVHPSSYVLTGTSIGLAGPSRPLTIAVTAKDGPELHAFVFGFAPLSLRFDGGTSTSEQSRWDTSADRIDRLDGKGGWEGQSSIEWYTGKYRSSAASSPAAERVIAEGTGCVMITVFEGGPTK